LIGIEPSEAFRSIPRDVSVMLNDGGARFLDLAPPLTTAIGPIGAFGIIGIV
jgi:hypothetical protein